MEFYGKLKVMETGREEVEQREQEKGLAEKGAANGTASSSLSPPSAAFPFLARFTVP